MPEENKLRGGKASNSTELLADLIDYFDSEIAILKHGRSVTVKGHQDQPYFKSVMDNYNSDIFKFESLRKLIDAQIENQKWMADAGRVLNEAGCVIAEHLVDRLPMGIRAIIETCPVDFTANVQVQAIR